MEQVTWVCGPNVIHQAARCSLGASRLCHLAHARSSVSPRQRQPPPDYGNNRFGKTEHRQSIHLEKIGVRKKRKKSRDEEGEGYGGEGRG